MSKLNDILTFVQGVVQEQTSTVNGQALKAVIRKLPKREETVDVPYMVTISGAEQVDRIKRLSFGGNYWVLYTIEITLVTPNDRDELINLADHAAWREGTRAVFMVNGMMNSVGNIYRIEVMQSQFLDRAEIKDGYDYTQVVLEVTTWESR